MAKCRTPLLKWQLVRSEGPLEVHLNVKLQDLTPHTFILSFLVIASVMFFLNESFTSLRMMLLLGPMIVSLIICLILTLLEKIEICGNGVWQWGTLHPWEEYESFSWKWKTKDSVELRLVSKLWICSSTRLMVPPEDREAVQQLLEANLPNLNAIRMNS